MHTRALVTLFVLAWCGAAQAEISFTDVSESAGIDRSGESYGASWGDLDGDGYPDLFVSMHRRQPSLFLNTRKGDFIDVGKQTFRWLNNPNADTHGGTWFDFDNDGDQDLFVTTGIGNPDQFLVNDRGALIDRTAALGVVERAWGGRLPVWLDYDNDGLPDFVMTQLGGIADLMRQLPGGGFVRRTGDVRMLCRPWQYAQLLDVTGDGRLDLVCPDREVYPHRIWNTLPVPWQDVTDRIPPVDTVADSVLADFDNDGRMDVFLLGRVQTHPSGVSLGNDEHLLEARLMGETKSFDFVTSGEVTFEIYQEGFGLPRVRIGNAGMIPSESTITLSPSDPRVAGMPPDPGLTPILFIGFDPQTERWTVQMRSRTEDGEQIWSEVYFVIRSTEPIRNPRAQGLWVTDRPAAPTLLLNRGTEFEDVTIAAGLDEPVECVSAAAGDFNNDMHVDLFLACRRAASNIENILYENRGDGTFVRVAGAGGAAGPIGLAVSEGAGTAETVAVADYDLDGYLDLFVTNGLNLSPVGVGGPLKLYRNNGGSNRWIELDLVGTGSHREAVGARVEVSAGGVVQTRVKNGSYHRWAHDHTRMHFGLAQEERADITIHWPSGLTETHTDVAAGAVYRATEGAGIAVISPDTAAPYACGLPEDPIIERGVFVGRRCYDDTWQVRVSDGGGDERITYRGRLISAEPYVGTAIPRGLESGVDVLEVEGSEIRFAFSTRSGDWDGFDFRIQPGSQTCFILEEPLETRVHLGIRRDRVPIEFELISGGLCPGREPPPPIVPDPDDDPGDGDGSGDGDDPGNDDDGAGDGDDDGDGSGDGDDSGSGNGGTGGSGGSDDDSGDGDGDGNGPGDDGGNPQEPSAQTGGGGSGSLSIAALLFAFASLPVMIRRRGVRRHRERTGQESRQTMIGINEGAREVRI
jgi:hypothetical protein